MQNLFYDFSAPDMEEHTNDFYSYHGQVTHHTPSIAPPSTETTLPEAKAKPSPIHEVPTELWLMIMEYLSLAEALKLSRTCMRLRGVVVKEHGNIHLKVQQLPKLEKIMFFLELASTDMDRWACIDCMKLHRVVFPDKDCTTSAWPPRCPRPSGLSIGPVPQARTKPNTAYSSIRTKGEQFCYGEIQVAVKYSRQPAGRLAERHRTFLDLLLKPHYEEKVYGEGPPGFRTRRQIQYRVKKGRLLIYDEHICHPFDSRKPSVKTIFNLTTHMVDQGFAEASGCPHWRPGSIDVYWLLSKGPGHGRVRSCRKCDTDAEVWCEEDEAGCRSVILRSWHDAGAVIPGVPSPGRRHGRRCRDMQVNSERYSSVMTGGIQYMFDEGAEYEGRSRYGEAEGELNV